MIIFEKFMKKHDFLVSFSVKMIKILKIMKIIKVDKVHKK